MIRVYSDGDEKYISLDDLCSYLECGREQFGCWYASSIKRKKYLLISDYVQITSKRIINNKLSENRMYQWRRLRIEALVDYLKGFTNNKELICINN